MSDRKEMTMPYTKAQIVMGTVSNAIEEADAKHGDNLHLTGLEWLAVLAEEFGEAAAIVTKREVPPVNLTADSPTSRHLRDELLQVAATAVRWVRAIDEQNR